MDTFPETFNRTNVFERWSRAIKQKIDEEMEANLELLRRYRSEIYIVLNNPKCESSTKYHEYLKFHLNGLSFKHIHQLIGEIADRGFDVEFANGCHNWLNYNNNKDRLESINCDRTIRIKLPPLPKKLC